ncbi:hypothetical protein BEP19_12340 [Ammoniphilus oxalaticus]|uniref:DUF3923 domain-containing protein n=1 Tax=Ammoniphilus oxalaticus TaxID=66863 RepID=A0A419SGV8_9BACL|nr:hypothetical protein [Ammoniphilus oxalaticus]RKD23013.1 hypothetical protein BEP19_12340 [Ammoniphilus oxalaticus]
MNVAYRIGAVVLSAWFIYLISSLLVFNQVTDPAKFARLVLIAFFGSIFFFLYFIIIYIIDVIKHRKKRV